MINLDAASDTELTTLIQNNQIQGIAAEYADLLLIARRWRLSGNIDAAMRREAECEELYDMLPSEQRW